MTETKHAPYFSPCEDCGKHGHIVYADGKKRSSEFATISKGLDWLTALVVAKEISWNESREVEQQIKASDLVCDDRDLDAYMDWLITKDEIERKMVETEDGQRESVISRRRRTLH